MIAKSEMLIRKPVAEVFEAFVNPAITTQFWFTKSSGRLEAGKQIRWEWEVYNASTDVDVKVIEPNKLILVEWLLRILQPSNGFLQLDQMTQRL